MTRRPRSTQGVRSARSDHREPGVPGMRSNTRSLSRTPHSVHAMVRPSDVVRERSTTSSVDDDGVTTRVRSVAVVDGCDLARSRPTKSLQLLTQDHLSEGLRLGTVEELTGVVAVAESGRLVERRTCLQVRTHRVAHTHVV